MQQYIHTCVFARDFVHVHLLFVFTCMYLHVCFSSACAYFTLCMCTLQFGTFCLHIFVPACIFQCVLACCSTCIAVCVHDCCGAVLPFVFPSMHPHFVEQHMHSHAFSVDISSNACVFYYECSHACIHILQACGHRSFLCISFCICM